MTFGHLYFCAQGYVPTWMISIVCLALELVGSWVELGFSVWKLLDDLLSITLPWNQEFSDVLKFWS